MAATAYTRRSGYDFAREWEEELMDACKGLVIPSPSNKVKTILGSTPPSLTSSTGTLTVSLGASELRTPASGSLIAPTPVIEYESLRTTFARPDLVGLGILLTSAEACAAAAIGSRPSLTQVSGTFYPHPSAARASSGTPVRLHFGHAGCVWIPKPNTTQAAHLAKLDPLKEFLHVKQNSVTHPSQRIYGVDPLSTSRAFPTRDAIGTTVHPTSRDATDLDPLPINAPCPSKPKMAHKALFEDTRGFPRAVDEEEAGGEDEDEEECEERDDEWNDDIDWVEAVDAGSEFSA